MSAQNILFTYLILCAVSLFGSLIASCVTNDPVYFVFGYPVAVVFLILSSMMRARGVR